MAGRPWTRSEEIEACTLRWLDYGDRRIGRLLGRTAEAIHSKLADLLPRRKRLHEVAELRRKFMQLYRRGLNDVEIARRCGLAKSTINTTRRRLRLPPNLNRSEVARLGGKELSRRRRAERGELRGIAQCWGCSRLARSPRSLKDEGWVVRERKTMAAGKEMYCRRCFELYGWGDELSKVVRSA